MAKTAKEIVEDVARQYGSDRNKIIEVLESYGYIVSDSENLSTIEGRRKLNQDMRSQPNTSPHVQSMMDEYQQKYLQEFNAFCDSVNAMDKVEVIGLLIEQMSEPGCVANEFFSIEDFNDMTIGKLRSIAIMERAESPIVIKRKHYTTIKEHNQAMEEEEKKERKAIEDALNHPVTNEDRKRAGVLPLFYQAGLNDYNDDNNKLVDWIQSLLNRSDGTLELVINGDRGNGKTWAAATVVNEMLKHGRNKVRIVSLDEFSMKMNNFEGQNEYLHNLRGLELLILDDFGAYQLTEKKQQALYALIKNRHANKRYTAFCIPAGRKCFYSTDLEHEVDSVEVRATIVKEKKNEKRA